MNPFGQIGQQMADTGIELIKDTASSAVKAATDISKGSVEQVLSPAAPKDAGGDKNVEQGKSAKDPNAVNQKKAEEKKRFEEVKEELKKYVEMKRQQDVQIAREKAQKQQEDKQNEEQKKQESDNWLKNLMRRSSSHGEVEKQKE